MLGRLEQQLLKTTFVVLSLLLLPVAAAHAQYPGGEDCSSAQLECLEDVDDVVEFGTCITGNACSDLYPRQNYEAGGIVCTRIGSDEDYVYRFEFTVDNLDECDDADVGGIKGLQKSEIRLRLFGGSGNDPHYKVILWNDNECLPAKFSRNFLVDIPDEEAIENDYTCCEVWVDNNKAVDEEIDSNNYANHNGFQVALRTAQLVDIEAFVSNIDNSQSVTLRHQILNIPPGWSVSVSPDPVILAPDGVSTITLSYFAPGGASVPELPIVVVSTADENGFVQRNSFEFVGEIPTLSDVGLVVLGLILMVAMALTIHWRHRERLARNR